ncbi:MAG: hypothetical protein FJW39_11400 [Acidobacteria bacterium]|nr:hypothetical protein [Acidobacteriota bacterium]
MGTYIHFKGCLDDPSRIDEVFADVREFANAVGWTTEDYTEHVSGVMIVTPEQEDDPNPPPPEKLDPEDEPFPKGFGKRGAITIQARVRKRHPPPLLEETLRGIIVRARETPGVLLKFNSTGRLVEFLELPTEYIMNAIPETVHYIAYAKWVCTTGSVDEHMFMCALFDRLKRKFMSNLHISDNTGYWDERDLRKLRREQIIQGSFKRMMSDPGSAELFVKAAGLVPEDAKVRPVTEADLARPKPKRRSASKPS